MNVRNFVAQDREKKYSKNNLTLVEQKINTRYLFPKMFATIFLRLTGMT